MIGRKCNLVGFQISIHWIVGDLLQPSPPTKLARFD